MSDQHSDPDELPPLDEVPWFQDRNHYGAIATLLQAFGLDAHLSSNRLVLTIHAKTEDGREVVWSNITDGELWAWSIVEEDGRIGCGTTAIPGTAEAEQVARLISEQDYAPSAN